MTLEEWMFEKIGWLGEKTVTCEAEDIKEAMKGYAKEVAIEAVKLAREINVPTGGGIIIQVGKYTEQEILEKLKL